MQGKIEFNCDDCGIKGFVHIRDVSLADKFHLLHTLESALETSNEEFQLYAIIGRELANKHTEQTHIDKSKLDEILFGGSNSELDELKDDEFDD